MPNLISSLPKFNSPEQHRNLVAQTPESFADIPTVLRHKEEEVSVSLDPLLDGFPVEEGAKGTLYVLESSLIFMSSNDHGFEVEYPHITLHAVSRSGQPCVYCQLEDPLNAIEAEEDEEFAPMRELRIQPTNPESVDAIFEALSLCASLHPDEPDPSDSEGEGDDEAFIDTANFERFEGTEEEELSAVGRAALDYLESVIDNPYEDAEEHEEHEQEEKDKQEGKNGNAEEMVKKP